MDPLKERQADEIALRNRTTSRRRIILAGGEVPEEIWAELQEEDKLFTPKQLQPFVPGGQGGGQDEGQDGQDDGQPDPPPEDDDRDDEPEDTDEDQP